MSTATVDSTRSERLPRSLTVRSGVVTRKPPCVVWSDVGRAALVSFTPARVRMDSSRGMVTSIGWHGGRSSPWIHAAVRPEKADCAGSRFSTARSVSSTSLRKPVHEYWPRLILRQLRVWRPSQDTPASLASATANGPPLRSEGMHDRIARLAACCRSSPTNNAGC